MLELMKQRKAELLKLTKPVKDFINEITDEYSFVELDAFSFSKDEVFECAGAAGEGVVTGYARIEGHPVYIVAQNPDVLSGGVTKAQSDKILKCMNLAEKSDSALIYVLASSGAKVGEGLKVLDGYGQIIAKSSSLYGVIPQFSVIKGECYGSISYFAALSDVVIATKGGLLSSSSANVINAKSGGSMTAEQLSGSAALDKNGFASLTVNNNAELKTKLSSLLSYFSAEIIDMDEASLNEGCEALNNSYSVKSLVEGVFDADSFLELQKGFGSELKIGLGRIGGITVGAVISGEGEKGILLTGAGAQKAASFIRMLDSYNIPFVSFVNVSGSELSLSAEQNGIVRSVASLLSAVSDCTSSKISVVCGKAQGIGYTAFASKSLGFDYTVSWANASISVLSNEIGVNTLYADQISSAKFPEKAREEVAKKYASIEGDPFNAAYGGLVDNIIEPSTTRQYLISALQMLNA